MLGMPDFRLQILIYDISDYDNMNFEDCCQISMVKWLHSQRFFVL